MKKNRRSVAVPLPVDNQEGLERQVLAHTQKFRRLLDAAEKRIKRRGGLTHVEFWKSLKTRS